MYREGIVPHPLSILTHKYGPGNCGFGDLDLAVRPEGPPPGLQCPSCHEPLTSRRGLPNAPVARRRTSTQVAALVVAVDGTLHSRDSLEAGLSFSGRVTGDLEAWQLLTEIAEEMSLSVGGRRTTRGLVKVEISDDPVGEGAMPLPCDESLLVLRLESPAVFVTDDGRPRNAPDPMTLAASLGVDRVDIKGQWSRWEQIGGWHAASNLPKPVEVAVTAGSTYLIRTSSRPSDDALASLISAGVGLRRHEIGRAHV